MWASDVSEKGFQYLKGFAVVPVEKKTRTCLEPNWLVG